MKTILRGALQHFESLNEFLKNLNDSTLTQLSIATEEAYVFMNEGMCASDSVCHECADHRDFIRKMLDVLSTLEEGKESIAAYKDEFSQFSVRVTKIVDKLRTALAAS